MTESDLELVLAWRSNPQIYDYFREQNGPLKWEAHVSWYESRDSDRHDFMIHYQDRRVGVVSVSSDDEISTYLGDFSARGQGVAKSSLNWICNQFENRAQLVAEIHQENTKSHHLFKKCGFRKQAKNGDWTKYIYGP